MRITASGLGAGIAALGIALLTSQSSLAAEKLVVAADVGYAPHVMAKPAGGYEGYNVDMIIEIARRMGREYEIVDQEWSGIFAGLNAKKYDFIIAPTTVTPERAEKMLFMEGYLDSEIVFLVKKEASEVTKLEDLKGKVLSVNKGNIYDKWATERAEKYGWTLQRFGKNADAIQAVLSGRAFANIASGSSSGWAAKQNPLLKTSLVVNTGRVFSAPFRLEDVALRNQIEEVVECMKLDGFFSKLHEKWFSAPAQAGSSMVSVEAGYGAPGVKGHVGSFHRPKCG
jgi:polar amino acid transport system substrate-binding protein